jgi:putative acetyltransferase
MHLHLESPDQPDVIALIAELDAFQDGLYPAESRYALDLASLMQANVRFVVARDSSGAAIGCGAVVLYQSYGELKRMYVREQLRGKGVARGILDLLEASARQAGCTVFTLETGPYQPQALAFYERSGYVRCARFGDYQDDPLSVFMRKEMAASAPAFLLFVITLTYVKPMDEVDRHLAAHRDYLSAQYAQGSFLLSGPREPRTGGVILARAGSLDELHRRLEADPFKIHGVAEYAIVAFHARASAPGLNHLIGNAPTAVCD